MHSILEYPISYKRQSKPLNGSFNGRNHQFMIENESQASKVNSVITRKGNLTKQSIQSINQKVQIILKNKVLMEEPKMIQNSDIFTPNDFTNRLQVPVRVHDSMQSHSLNVSPNL